MLITNLIKRDNQPYRNSNTQHYKNSDMPKCNVKSLHQLTEILYHLSNSFQLLPLYPIQYILFHIISLALVFQILMSHIRQLNTPRQTPISINPEIQGQPKPGDQLRYTTKSDHNLYVNINSPKLPKRISYGSEIEQKSSRKSSTNDLYVFGNNEIVSKQYPSKINQKQENPSLPQNPYKKQSSSILVNDNPQQNLQPSCCAGNNNKCVIM